MARCQKWSFLPVTGHASIPIKNTFNRFDDWNGLFTIVLEPKPFPSFLFFLFFFRHKSLVFLDTTVKNRKFVSIQILQNALSIKFSKGSPMINQVNPFSQKFLFTSTKMMKSFKTSHFKILEGHEI